MAQEKLFFHISFNFEGRKPPRDEIESVLNKSLDWVRYAPNCYLIYTKTINPETWYKRLRAVVNKDDSIFIVEANIDNRQGWLPTYVWNWIDKDRTTPAEKS